MSRMIPYDVSVISTAGPPLRYVARIEAVDEHSAALIAIRRAGCEGRLCAVSVSAGYGDETSYITDYKTGYRTLEDYSQ
jgi:hypothetical protein